MAAGAVVPVAVGLAVSLLGGSAAIAIAIVRHHHFALERALDRALVHVVLSGLVAGVFVALVLAIGAAFSATYYKGQSFGLTGEAFLIGLGYDDSCQILGTPNYTDNIERCTFIDERDRSAAAVAASVGGIYRFAAREFLSPFIRGTVGVLINNQSPISLTGQTNRGSVLVIYDDDNPGTRLRPAFELGVGSTIATSPAYQIRWEVRDNIVGVQEVTGPVDLIGGVPPNKTVYKHLFSILIGLDVVLERHRGRRY